MLERVSLTSMTMEMVTSTNCGWDFIDNENDPYDFKGHGTEVAGIIAAELDGVGIQGISDSTYIYPIRG